jgi:surface polysaccharide O-acyltransferase-like enzyme
LHYLDTLRVLAVLAVFLFHASKPFTEGGDWRIMNAQTSLVASAIFGALLAPWGMPFFFLLAGAGTWFALQHRSARQYASERFRRLLIPFVIGSLLLTPVQSYLEWKFATQADAFAGSYLDFILDRWDGWNPLIFGWMGYHLWFLGFLLTISLLALPLLRWLKGTSGQGVISRLAQLCERRGGILLFALPLLVIQLSLRPLFPEAYNWQDFFYYLLFFLLGYLFYADERFLRAVRRDWWLALIVGIVTLLGILTTLALGEADTLMDTPSAPGFYLFWVCAVIDAWCWSLFMLSVGMRYLDFSNKWLQHGQAAIVPFYVFHQPIILAIAFYAVRWETGILPKMLAVTLGAFVVTSAIYVLLVRRVAPLRAAFGMKVAVQPPAAPPQEATSARRSATLPSA